MKHQLNHWKSKIKVYDNSQQNHFKIKLCTTINVYSLSSKSDYSPILSGEIKFNFLLFYIKSSYTMCVYTIDFI